MRTLLLSAVCYFLGAGYLQAQNADPVVNIFASDNTILVNSDAVIEVDAGNFGSGSIAAASLELKIKSGAATEIIGVSLPAGSKWTLFASTTGAGNTYTFHNNAEFNVSFDISSFSVTVRGLAQSPSDFIVASVGYLPGPNPNIAGFPESNLQGNGATDNDTSQTTLVISTPTVLPLRLISFSGTEAPCAAAFSWKAMDDVELATYELQQSTDGLRFETVAQVPSRRSPLVSAYSFTLPRKDAGPYFYRLRMAAVDGRIHYSSTVTVRSNCNELRVQLYPNPAHSVLQVTGVRAGDRLSIRNGTGQLLRTVVATGPNSSIPVSQLPAGVYYLHIDGTEGAPLRFVKSER